MIRCSRSDTSEHLSDIGMCVFYVIHKASNTYTFSCYQYYIVKYNYMWLENFGEVYTASKISSILFSKIEMPISKMAHYC